MEKNTSIETINEILTRRKNSILVPCKYESILTQQGRAVKLSICRMYLEHGLVPSTKVINSYLTAYSDRVTMEGSDTAGDYITSIITRDIHTICETLGLNRRYVQLFNNIKEAAELTDTLYGLVMQCIHYLSGGTWLPHTNEDTGVMEDYHTRFNIDYDNLILINGADIDVVYEIMDELISSKTSIRDEDFDDLFKIMDFRKSVDGFHTTTMLSKLANKCSYKEILVRVVAKMIQDGDFDSFDDNTISLFREYGLFMNYKDILRLAVTLLGGHPALCEHPLVKRKTMKVTWRNFIMRLMNNVPLHTIKTMKPDREAWIVIGDVIHPYRYIPKNIKLIPKYRVDKHVVLLEKEIPKYAHAITAWLCIREKSYITSEPYDSFETLMEDGYIEDAVDLIKDKPALFCRKIDYLIRESNLSQGLKIMRDFEDALETGQVPIPTLLTLLKHFRYRYNESKFRMFTIKSIRTKLYKRDEYRKPINKTVCEMLEDLLRDAIHNGLSNYDTLGKVYINDAVFKEFAIQKSLRNQSAGRLIPRGSVFKIPENMKFLAPYIWWTNPKNNERLDLDLSAFLYTKDFGKCCKLYYGNIHLDPLGDNIVHSGDITNGGRYDGNGVSESILINTEDLGDYAYIVFTVHSYTPLPFSNQEHSYAGYALYSEVDKDIYEQRSEFIDRNHIVREVNLSTESTDSVIAIYDVENRELIWVDQSGKPTERTFTNVNDTSDSTLLRVMSMLETREISLYELIHMNIEARGGEIVTDKAEADIIFDEYSGVEELDEKTITPFNSEYFTSNMM